VHRLYDDDDANQESNNYEFLAKTDDGDEEDSGLNADDTDFSDPSSIRRRHLKM